MESQRPRSLLFLVVPSLFLGSTVLGQEKPAPELGAQRASSIQRAAHGAALVDGELWGVGPDYKVLFRDGGFEFTPALGGAAPHNFPLSFELEAIERGGVVVYAPASASAPALGTGDVVRYAHAGGIEERYAMRADGVEQSFSFAEPLPGTGDLIVRGRLATELGAPDGEREVLDFALQGLGGVRVGAVTGVDAAGQTAPGSLRYDGEFVELVLPAAFVDGAAYPLVLDPLIGAWFFIDGFVSLDDRSPDVAFDLNYDLYLVAWEREFSAVDIDVRAQRVAAQSGALLGGLLPVTSVSGIAERPSVANVRVSHRFLVAWDRFAGGIEVRAVNASDGGLSSVLALDVSADATYPAVCGEQTLVDDDALVVWKHYGSSTGIYGAEVAVPASGAPSSVSTFTVTTDGAGNPAIAKSCGTAGRALLAYEKNGDLYQRLLDRNGTLLTGASVLASSALTEAQPAVDGDGTSWIVAYSSYNFSTNEIYCRRVTFDPSSSAVSYGAPTNLTSDALAQYFPAVAWTPGKAFVAWEQQYGPGDNDIYVKGIDPFDCKTCEATVNLDYSETYDTMPRLASKYSGGSSTDQVFATWFSALTTPLLDNGDIKGQFLEAFGAGGTVANLGGGCGSGGAIGMTGPVAIGNPSFAVTLSGADPAATVGWLVLAPVGAALYSCGPCSVLLSGSFAVPMSGGFASVSLPLPCDLGLAGVQIDAQWVVAPTTSVPCPLLGGVSASNRWRFTLGQ